MEKSINKFTDEELLEIIRTPDDERAGYREVGLHHKAEREWQIRQQQRLINDQNEYNKKILKVNRNLVYATFALVIVTLIVSAVQINLLQTQNIEGKNVESSRLMFDLTQQIRTGASSDLIYAIASDQEPLLQRNGGKFSDEQLDNYLVEYELLDQAYQSKLITKDMLSVAFSYDIESAYQNSEITTFINQVRKDNKDNSIYQGFLNLAILLKK